MTVLTKKKVLIPLLCILCALLLLLVYSVVYNSDLFSNSAYHAVKCPEGMDPQVALKIRKEYLNICRSRPNSGLFDCKLRDIEITEYYGNYSGCEVVMVDWARIVAYSGFVPPPAVDIAGYTIVLPPYGGVVYVVFKDSKLYNLKRAYYLGMITKEDVYDLGLKIDPLFQENNPTP